MGAESSCGKGKESSETPGENAHNQEGPRVLEPLLVKVFVEG